MYVYIIYHVYFFIFYITFTDWNDCHIILIHHSSIHCLNARYHHLNKCEIQFIIIRVTYTVLTFPLCLLWMAVHVTFLAFGRLLLLLQNALWEISTNFYWCLKNINYVTFRSCMSKGCLCFTRFYAFVQYWEKWWF